MSISLHITNNQPSISVILVSGGDGTGVYQPASVEVLFPNGTSYCTLPDLPVYRYAHTQDGLTACGGDDGAESVTRDNCVTLRDGQWTQSHTLLQNRIYHTSWALGDGRVVLMGGTYSPNTTEIISPAGSPNITEGFTLKYDTWYTTQHIHLKSTTLPVMVHSKILEICVAFAS